MAVASGSLEVADRLLESIYRRFLLLGKYPHAGRRRDDLREGLRIFPSGQYVVLYRVEGKDALIQRVVRGSRDLAALLRDEDVRQQQSCRPPPCDSESRTTIVDGRIRRASGHALAVDPSGVDLRGAPGGSRAPATLKFLVDAQLPPALARWISARGHVARHVFDIGLQTANDPDVWEHARSEDAVLVSKDETSSSCAAS